MFSCLLGLPWYTFFFCYSPSQLLRGDCSSVLPHSTGKQSQIPKKMFLVSAFYSFCIPPTHPDPENSHLLHTPLRSRIQSNTYLNDTDNNKTRVFFLKYFPSSIYLLSKCSFKVHVLFTSKELQHLSLVFLR